MMNNKKYLVPLLMARRQYDVANIMYDHSILDKLFIDSYYNPSRYWIFRILDIICPKKYKLQYLKYQPKVDDEMIVSSWSISLQFRFDLWREKSNVNYLAQIKAYQSLNNLVVNYLSKNFNTNIYSLDTASLEVFRFIKSRSGDRDTNLVLEQCVAPRYRQLEMYRLFKKNGVLEDISDWERHCIELSKREEAEWELADKIITPSPFVRDSIIKKGVNRDKVIYLPYGFKPSKRKEDMLCFVKEKFDRNKGKNRVLFVGNAGYRKGVHDVIEIALVMPDVDFHIVGAIDSKVRGELPGNVTYFGKLQKDELEMQYMCADLFLFPSYLEGSALVTFEALSWGLPLITTEEAGSVARNGKEGYVFSASMIRDMVDKIRLLLMDEKLRYNFSINAVHRAYNFTLHEYERELLKLLNDD